MRKDRYALARHGAGEDRVYSGWHTLGASVMDEQSVVIVLANIAGERQRKSRPSAPPRHGL